MGMRQWLHYESQVLQLSLHAIEIAAHFFQAANGIAGVLCTHAVSAASKETTQHFSRLPRIDPGLQELVAQVEQLACGKFLDFGICRHCVFLSPHLYSETLA